MDDGTDVPPGAIEANMYGVLARRHAFDRCAVRDTHGGHVVAPDRNPTGAVSVDLEDVVVSNADVTVHVEDARDSQHPRREDDRVRGSRL